MLGTTRQATLLSALSLLAASSTILAWGEVPARLKSESEWVTLTAQGGCSRVAEKTFVVSGNGRRVLCRLMPVPPAGRATVVTAAGKSVRLQANKEGKRYTWRFSLPAAARKGDVLTYRLEQKQVDLLRREGVLWVYDRTHRLLPDVNYQHTVVLPPGAEPTLVKPRPLKVEKVNGLPTMHFGAVVATTRDLRLTVKYGFPTQAKPGK